MTSGFAALDAELPGAGWPSATLVELISREPGNDELRLLVPLLRQSTRSGRIVVLLGPPEHVEPADLARFGVDPDYLLVVHAPNAPDRLWAVERALRSACFGALLAWLPAPPNLPEHLRRMQAVAQRVGGPVFVFRHLAAQFQTSPAPLRLLLQRRPAPELSPQLSVQLLKRRGPVLARPLLVELPQPVIALRLRSTGRSVPREAGMRRAGDRQGAIARAT